MKFTISHLKWVCSQKIALLARYNSKNDQSRPRRDSNPQSLPISVSGKQRLAIRPLGRRFWSINRPEYESGKLSMLNNGVRCKMPNQTHHRSSSCTNLLAKIHQLYFCTIKRNDRLRCVPIIRLRLSTRSLANSPESEGKDGGLPTNVQHSASDDDQFRHNYIALYIS